VLAAVELAARQADPGVSSSPAVMLQLAVPVEMIAASAGLPER
jgi:hypothetical protein